MTLENKKIGFAITGSFRTLSLIRLNDLIVKKFGWVHFRFCGCIFLEVGAFSILWVHFP